MTPDEIRDRLRREKKVDVATGSIWRFYDRHKITSKKVLHAAEQDPSDVAAAREELKAEQPALKASRLVFIDEAAVTTSARRAATSVSVFQWPCGTFATSRSPRGARP